MTPFGERLRELRAGRGVTLKEMAAALQVSSAYLSALEHGHRGRPTDGLIHQICGYFGLIWDDAEALHRLAETSHPRVTIDTAGLAPTATRLAHRLARVIGELEEERLAALLEQLKDVARNPE